MRGVGGRLEGERGVGESEGEESEGEESDAFMWLQKQVTAYFSWSCRASLLAAAACFCASNSSRFKTCQTNQ